MQSVPTNTVRARIHRARKKMTALLESGAAAGGVAAPAVAAGGKK
jgi:DNA-directed RNA polymerase specialized sigma24 family protein